MQTSGVYEAVGFLIEKNNRIMIENFVLHQDGQKTATTAE